MLITQGIPMIFNSIDDVITDNIFLKLPKYLDHLGIYLKLEGLNPAGSIKLKTAVSLINDAELNKGLSTDVEVIESSSGNLGVALSMVCAARGYKFTCVVDPNTPEQMIKIMSAFGANVVSVNQRDANGGFLGSRIAYIKRCLVEKSKLIWLNQYANPANPRAHSCYTATAILNEFKSVDYLFIGAGTTGTLMGCIHKFKEMSPSTIIVAVDAVGSVTFGQQPGSRYIPGLGTSRRPEIFNPDITDESVFVEELETIEECHFLVSKYGLLAGGSTGTVLAGIKKYKGEIPSGSTVVAISPDMGWHYINSVYSRDWIASKYEMQRQSGAICHKPEQYVTAHHLPL